VRSATAEADGQIRLSRGALGMLTGQDTRAIEVFVAARREGPSGEFPTFSVWALSAFDALEQGRLALPLEEELDRPTRNGVIARVALCIGHSDPSVGGTYAYVSTCSHVGCSRGHRRIGVIK